MATIKMSTRLEKAVQDYLETLGKSFATVRLSDTEVKATLDGDTYYYKLYSDSGIVFQYNMTKVTFVRRSTLYTIEKIGEMTRMYELVNETMSPIDDRHYIFNVQESYL